MKSWLMRRIPQADWLIYGAFMCGSYTDTDRAMPQLQQRRTILEAVSHLESGQNSFATEGPRSAEAGEDPRWQLTRRVVSGRHFSRSPLLSKFLEYIVEKALDGRHSEITE